MQIKNSLKSDEQKLRYFLELALHGQQLSLIIYNNNPEFQSSLAHLSSTQGHQIQHIDSLDKLAGLKQALAIIELNQNNLMEFLNFVQKAIPTLNNYGHISVLPDGVKTLFLISKEFLSSQSAATQEIIRKTFLPIFQCA